MAETIKEIYDNVTKLFNHIANNFIGQKYDKNIINQLKYSIDTTLRQMYPYYEFNTKLTLNEYSHEVIIDLDPNFVNFPKINYKNYNTHNFVEIKKEDTFYLFPTMRCTNCNLLISENGNLIDGDFSCYEFTIKNLLE